jgi:FKBP-type peptidyl-prolyl cis-trans isomerase
MAVEQIPIGRRAKVTCPSVLAYGKRGVGPIPGDSDLIFDISVIGAQ